MGGHNPWIAIDGCIGAGKTTLARILGDVLGAQVELEASDKHPFLADFYAAPKETALQTEICFVLIHYHQLASVLLNRAKPLVTDFTLSKDPIFAATNLSDTEYALFHTVFDHFAPLLQEPDLIVYLEASNDLLWRRMKLRDRPFERNMSREYLAELNALYQECFYALPAERLLRLRADDFDVVNSEKDRSSIIQQIDAAIEL